MKLSHPKFKRVLSLESRGKCRLAELTQGTSPRFREFSLKYPGVPSGFTVRVASLDTNGAAVRVSAYHPTLPARQWLPATRAIEHIFGGPRGT